MFETYRWLTRFGLNIFYSEEKDLVRVIQCDNALSRGSIYNKNLIIHTYAHTLSRIGCLIIPNITITRQYDSQVNITNYNLPVSSINLCTTSKTVLHIVIPRSADLYIDNSHEISVIVSSLISFNIIFLAW